jgi:hypothetical protein
MAESLVSVAAQWIGQRMSVTRSARGEDPSADTHQLWAEALWGVGLVGSVLVVVVLIAAIFGP